MFPEDALFEYVLETLAQQLASFQSPICRPIGCDRYLARSLLQKAVRRGEVDMAWRALATLLAEDRYPSFWALTVISLEDVGVSGMDVVAGVIAAGRDRKWRTAHGGEWKVAAFLVKQMCESTHCQAACDLLLRSLNDPALASERGRALETDEDELIDSIRDTAMPVGLTAVAALAVGGGLAEGQRYSDPHGVFDALAESGYSSHVVATCRAAWRSTRNEMAMLLPLIWQSWMAVGEKHSITDDDLPPVGLIGELPGYAVDQFTRAGGQVARTLLKQDYSLGSLLGEAGIAPVDQHRAVGDLIFLIEGSGLRRRANWQLGDQLRRPYRQLPSVGSGKWVGQGMAYIAGKGSGIAELRRAIILRR